MKIWNLISGVASTLFVASMLTISVSMSFPSAAEAAAPACKGPNKNDPGCPDGGDGGTGETTCATSETFPTFLFWDQISGGGEALSLSDAEGTCTVPLTTFADPGTFPGATAFYYDKSSGWGRALYTNKMIGTLLYLVEFTVGAENAVNVEHESIILAEGRWGGEDGSIRKVIFVPNGNGDTIAFIYRWSIEGAAETGGYAIYMASITGCLDDPWSLNYSGAPGCTQSLSALISDVPKANNEALYWLDLAFSDNNTKLFLQQFINANGGGTWVAEQDQVTGVWGDAVWDPLKLVPSVASMIDYGNGLREVVATGGSSVDNPCGELIFNDLENCNVERDCDPIFTETILGANPSWLADGRIIYEERIYKRQGRNYSCKTGDISIAEPFNSLVAPIRLFPGRDPLGPSQP